MKNIFYTEHLKTRLKARNIPNHYPEEIFLHPETNFIDNIEGHIIAIKKLEYNGKVRDMMVAYDEANSEVSIITIHPISLEDINKRRRTGRWTKI